MLDRIVVFLAPHILTSSLEKNRLFSTSIYRYRRTATSGTQIPSQPLLLARHALVHRAVRFRAHGGIAAGKPARGARVAGSGR